MESGILEIINVGTQEIVTTLNAPVGFQYSPPVWINNNTIQFNSVKLFEGIPSFENQYDIQQLTISGEYTVLAEIGQGGILTVSPDLQWMVVSRPGEYDNKSALGIIQILDSQTGEVSTPAYEFEGVATGTENTLVATNYME